ncbi:hypothetical protein ACLOAU_14495 [Niabella sp. CJ426]|uniref:hypothetical protein n=1 Tax=Niabella sp. CJ426 TaxID=3393740 RepID=UPI003CFED0B2
MEHHISNQLSEIKIEIQKREEQALTVSKPSETGDLLPVLQESRICFIQDPKNDELRGVLKYCMLLVGLRAHNVPGEIEKGVLIQFIKDNYGGHTISEIRLAFDKAVSGKLDIDDVNCYENFSPAYFGKIMNSYRRWASQQYYQEVKEDFIQKNYSESELENMQRQWTEEFYQRIRSGYVEKVPDYAKDILIKDGIVKNSDDVYQFFSYKLNSGVTNIYQKVSE